MEAPPPYDGHTRPPLSIPRLNPALGAGPPTAATVTRDQCIAHLKFLAVLADLRDTIGNTSGLFGLADADPRVFCEETNEAQIRIKEKRWAVYTTRAVERYTVWWNTCVDNRRPRTTTGDLYSSDYGSMTTLKHPMDWQPNILPPLDVLMVLHAHTLNPRAFLEDCIRYGQRGLWSSGFPLAAVDACINNETLEYHVPLPGVKAFEQKSGLPWDNLHGPDTTTVVCPSCAHEVVTPWTAGSISLPLDRAFDGFHGFADQKFSIRCSTCNLTIDHERLRVAKFRKDVEALLHREYPMPGTFYNLRGVPEESYIEREHSQSIFPNRFVKAIAFDLVRFTDVVTSRSRCRTVRALCDELEAKLHHQSTMAKVLGTSGLFTSKLLPQEKIAFRRMMARYWDNASPFALDLVGAVIRQGTFIRKMDDLDWLHSPTLQTTAARLIKKYELFFRIMVENPQQMAVPTLDVDLAWHTHQLFSGCYYQYSTSQTHRHLREKIFIDHDDKVDENKLSDGFEWTNKTYKDLTGGELYSECLCWYCEATRAPDLYRSRRFPSSSSSSLSAADKRAQDALRRLEHHNVETIFHPEKNPHISTHNAVRPQLTPSKFRSRHQDPREVKLMRLRSAYETARRRAFKRRRRSAVDSHPGSEPVLPRCLIAANEAVGALSAPFTSDPDLHGDAYVANPGCMSLAAGAPGNCAAGTCGGAVAAGSCGGMIGGGCAGGCAGGGGGSGGAACGGGGGGGGGSSGGCGGGGGA
ncbi:hypothetical protein BDV59DRAFT_192076 [Aspergillus ambiguus]|uniref:uncharacterized protein n=1 Tax=Aspergillus ambiguus TaxID=176160 RepID=UPI003CCD0C8A